MSRVPLLNEMGFFLVFGVVVDTALVRPLLVPALAGRCGAAHWWPARAATRRQLEVLTAAGAPGGAAARGGRGRSGGGVGMNDDNRQTE